ncbi:glutamine synthetase [Savagea faecisuis]|uniref:Glutamine synthetase n=1 Tax=Savagea faecisuis TaxID=1274803 RepID=A0ABW3GZR6_9BACL
MNETMHAKLREVDFIQLQFADLFGRAKHIEVPSSEYEKVLNNDMMFDGSSIEGFASIEASDMYVNYPPLS